MSDVETITYPIKKLTEFVVRVFEYLDIPKEDAHLASEVLATSDLRGIDSHGVARLHSYFGLLRQGRINPKPNIKILRESASTATVDGDNGLGLVVGPKSNLIALDKAEDAGTGWVSVSNTNHYGIAGYYPLIGLDRDMIGWSMTNSSSLVTPLWGAERMLGTNPLAIAFPGHEEPPIVIDMATCVAPLGKVEIAMRKKLPLPQGWAIDREGNPAIQPSEMLNEGALLPLGSDRDHGGHKGYCLAVMVDVLSCVLSGANWGPFGIPFVIDQEMPKRSVGKGIGHFFGAMRIDAFIDPLEFKKQIDDYIRVFRATKPAPGTQGPLIPGDPERKQEKIRSRDGIPLVLPVVEDLRYIAKTSGIPFDQ